MKKNKIFPLILIALLLSSCDTAEQGAHALVSLAFLAFKIGLIIVAIYVVFVFLVNLFSKK